MALDTRVYARTKTMARGELEPPTPRFQRRETGPEKGEKRCKLAVLATPRYPWFGLVPAG
jgi:hypothetical protein